MIYQVTQLQMQSIDEENDKNIISCTTLYQYTIKRIHLIATVLALLLWW